MANNGNNGDNGHFDLNQINLSDLSNNTYADDNADVLHGIVNDQSNELPKSLIITNMDIRIFNDSSKERVLFYLLMF